MRVAASVRGTRPARAASGNPRVNEGAIAVGEAHGGIADCMTPAMVLYCVQRLCPSRDEVERSDTMSKRILVVDDEKAITDLVHRLLSREGYEVSSASNGSQGLQRVDEIRPDLIITDISMPDMEGIEFISKLRKGSVSTPIIAMSGNAVGMSFLRATRLFGATETLLKPFTNEDLLSAVERSLGVV